jgi:hypothetical protein
VVLDPAVLPLAWATGGVEQWRTPAVKGDFGCFLVRWLGRPPQVETGGKAFRFSES